MRVEVVVPMGRGSEWERGWCRRLGRVVHQVFLSKVVCLGLEGRLLRKVEGSVVVPL